jgi:leader peptidase (prepilin peptidase)/N-methyltransferase
MGLEQVVNAGIAFLAGLLIGSFLNVCVFRLPRDLSVVQPRSFCPHCERTIAWYDNVPVVSFLVLHGRCRHCHERIPVRYPAVELATAVAFSVCVAVLGVTLLAVKFAVFSAILITLIATDFEEHILPDEFTLGGTLIGLVLAVFIPVEPGLVTLLLPASLSRHWVSLGEAVFSAVFFSGILWLAGWIYEKVRHREGLGFGDVKMLAMVGAFLGDSGAQLTLMIGGVLGVVIGGGYILIAKKKASEFELPYGSFLGIGAFIGLAVMWRMGILIQR